jgi:two-component system OmpR family response regulator
MNSLRVLHVDDEPDIRAIVEIALGLDPSFTVEGCASGPDALRAAAAQAPDIILLDVMMPGMDGPTTLAHLRESPKTANIPVVFMTARAQERELEQFRSLGAAGVIAKPFDPMKLAAAVRRYSQEARLAPLRASFVRRAHKDGEALAAFRRSLISVEGSVDALANVRTVAHGLSGTAGIYGFVDISEAAAALEREVIGDHAGNVSHGQVVRALDALLAIMVCLVEADGQEPYSGGLALRDSRPYVIA